MSRARDRELERRLAELRAPDETEAEERSWAVVRAAYAERAPIIAPARKRRLVLALAAGVLVLALALSPAGAKVADLVHDVVETGEPDARPALRSLPAAGELLVESRQGPWIVRADGSKRLLGDYAQASWSPHGIYVAVTEGRELIAVDTAGEVRWTYPAPGTVRDPRWAGDAADTRIAYRSGDDLRVIAGDGDPSSDHLIARSVAPVAPAWRPIGYSKLGPTGTSGFVLTYVDGGGEIRTVDADTGARVHTTRADRERVTAPGVGQSVGPAISPDGSAIAAIRATRTSDEVSLSRDGRREIVFRARGNLTGPTWSPDGGWLLVGWPAADQWLFIDANRPRHVVAFDHISEQFDPGGTGPAPFPRIAGWILPER
jgi:hypothetical protein